MNHIIRHLLARAEDGKNFIFLAMLSGLFLTSCAGNHSVYQIPGDSTSPEPVGVLAAGDVIQVSSPGTPELNFSQRIRPNGKVSMPVIGDILAAGKTVAGFRQEVSNLYVPHLRDPKVQVTVQTAAAAVYVSGEVLRPGKVPLERSMTALEAIMESGGFTKFANPKRVSVVRTKDGSQQRYELNLSQTLAGAGSQAFYVKPYDVIYVKQSNW